MLPGLLISAIAVGAALYFVDLGKFLEALRTADYRFIALGFLAAFVWLLVRGMVWRTLLQDKAGFKDVFFTINEGYLLNNVLPFRLGEVARAFLLSRKTDLNFFHILTTIVLERSLDVAFAAAILLSSLPFVVGAAWAKNASLLVGGIVIAGLAFLYVLARNKNWAMGVLEKLGKRWPFILKVGGNMLPAFFEGLGVFTNMVTFLRAIAWIILNWTLAILEYYFLVRAFFPEAQLLWGIFTLGAASLGIAVPSSPGSVGVYEGVIEAAMAVFTPNVSAALAYALVAHLASYLISGILGAYALARDGETLTGLYHSARSMLSARRQKT